MTLFINCLAVGAGGALGAVARFLLGLIPIKPQNGFPVITLFINVAGAFFIGILAALASKISGLDSRLLLFLKAGFCGGFTTFSTFSLETLQLFQNGRTALGILYIILSLLLGIGAAAAAQHIIR